MTRIVSSKSGRFKHQLNGDGSRTLVISDAYEFVECLRMIWQKANALTGDKSKIGLAFYSEMSRMFFNVTVVKIDDISKTQIDELSKEEEEAIKRSSEMTIFIDPRDILDEPM